MSESQDTAFLQNEAESGGSFGEFMGGLEEQVMQFVKESAKAPSTAWEHWGAFSSAVNWSETWIRCLIAFHVFMLLAVIVTRKSPDAQTVIFFFLGLIVYFSERLNSYCSDHWSEFSTQNYFDKKGVFTGLMLSGPIILILLYQLVNFMFLTADALIKVKKAELKRKYKDHPDNIKKNNSKEEEKETTAATTTAATTSGKDAKTVTTKTDSKKQK